MKGKEEKSGIMLQSSKQPVIGRFILPRSEKNADLIY